MYLTVCVHVMMIEYGAARHVFYLRVVTIHGGSHPRNHASESFPGQGVCHCRWDFHCPRSGRFVLLQAGECIAKKIEMSVLFINSSNGVSWCVVREG